MPWVSLQCVIVLFPDHTHLLFEIDRMQTGIHINAQRKYDNPVFDDRFLSKQKVYRNW